MERCRALGARLAEPYPLHGRQGAFDARVSASIGIAVCGGAGIDEELIQAADRALYAAKDGGKNQCVLAD